MSTPAPITPIRADEAGLSKSDAIAKRLIERRATLEADREFITAELDALDAQLLDLVGGVVGTHELGGSKVTVREYSRTDYAAVEAKYSAAEYPQLYETKTALDQAAVKREFAPAALEEFKVRGKKSVTVK
ncbi:MAG TPA: hypothetical protein VIP82_20855 [Microbacterium sp.]|uniref:hypothetical protein n=1 Tax=Microbacterium sp. TaxID=51671 RepID=UPI002F948259